jgi:hypothetical protein
MHMRSSIAFAGMLAASLLHAAPGHAQQMRTWVSGTGDDANPCSRTAMCKTFTGAMSKTAPGGEISVYDPGGFGSVTINKSISIVDVGAKASMLVAGTTGVTIKAGPTDVVLLDGLVLEGGGTGTTGISIVSAASVHIRDCVIRGFQAEPGLAIDVAPTAATQVFVSNCAIGKNSAGIRVKPADSGSARVFLERVDLENNAGSAIRAEGPNAVIRLNRTAITNNGAGLDLAGGSIITFGTNAISGNTVDGQPSHIERLQ